MISFVVMQLGVPAAHDEDGQLGVASVGGVPRIAPR
jgi:hypothetical protein